MAGGIIQLKCKGKQDEFFVFNPEITFFKTVYKRFTNFAIEPKKEYFSSLNFGCFSKCQIKKNGDLLSNLCIQVELPSLNNMNNKMGAPIPCKKKCNPKRGHNQTAPKTINDCCCLECVKEIEDLVFGWANAMGHTLVEEIELEIGGVIMDRHYGEWLEIWNELTQTSEKWAGYNEMIQKRDGVITPSTFKDAMTLYIPLNFWFCRNPGLAIPIVGLDDDIYINIKWRKFNECWITNKIGTKPSVLPTFNAYMIVEYVYLEAGERKEYACREHMYLVEQLQFTCDSFNKNTSCAYLDVRLNNPCKELIWVIQRCDVGERSDGDVCDDDFSYGNDWFNFSTSRSGRQAGVEETFKEGNLQLDGVNRFESMPAGYFRLVNPYYRNTRTPSNYVYSLSFALKPEDHQPTGYINMSNFGKIRLQLNMNKRDYGYNVKLYAISYNLFMISTHMAALVFHY
jgi:hypothetical protein